MTIVRGEDGRVFDIDEKILKKHQVKGSAAAPATIHVIIQVPPGCSVSTESGKDVGGRMVFGGPPETEAGRDEVRRPSSTCGVRG